MFPTLWNYATLNKRSVLHHGLTALNPFYYIDACLSRLLFKCQGAAHLLALRLTLIQLDCPSDGLWDRSGTPS